MLSNVDATTNPYAPGAGTRPYELVGRDDELELFRVLLTRLGGGRTEQPLLFHGLRGVGKTVLLLELRDIGTQEFGWVANLTEAPRGASVRQILGRQCQNLLRDMGSLGRARERLRTALELATTFRITVSPDGVIGAGLDLARQRAAAVQLEQDVTDLFRELAEAARAAGTGVLLLLDEVQELSDEDLAAVTVALHVIQQDELPLTVVAAGLPTALGRAGAARPYSERLFNFRPIGRLDRMAARRVLIDPALAEEGVTYTRVARDVLVVASDYFPFFLQAYGKQAWNLSAGPVIGAKDAQRARIATLAALDAGFFKTRTDQADRFEMRLMSAVASLGDGPQRVLDIQAMFDDSIDETIARLEQLGLLFSTADGDLEFTAPHLADHLRRRHPF